MARSLSTSGTIIPAQAFTADISLAAGHHLVVMEYYENGGFAVAKLTWQPKPAGIVNWQGEYFNNRTLAGSPTLTRDDANINLQLGYGRARRWPAGRQFFSTLDPND